MDYLSSLDQLLLLPVMLGVSLSLALFYFFVMEVFKKRVKVYIVQGKNILADAVCCDVCFRTKRPNKAPVIKNSIKENEIFRKLVLF